MQKEVVNLELTLGSFQQHLPLQSRNYIPHVQGGVIIFVSTKRIG